MIGRVGIRSRRCPAVSVEHMLIPWRASCSLFPERSTHAERLPLPGEPANHAFYPCFRSQRRRYALAACVPRITILGTVAMPSISLSEYN